MLHTPIYDPQKTFKENFEQGPFGDYADGKVFENQREPQYEVFGQKVYLPFGIGAGALPNAKFIKAALDKGYDIVVYKTVRSQEYPCNPLPNIVPLSLSGDLTIEMAKAGVVPSGEYIEPLSITNSFGVPSFSPDVWKPDMKKALSYTKKGQLVIGSFQGTVNKNGDRQAYIQDFATTAKMVQDTGAKVLEVNLSCPNEGSSHLLCFDPETTKQVVIAIKESIGDTPLIVKLAYFEDKEQLKQLIQEIGRFVQGVAATNTIATKIVKKDGMQYLSGGPRRLWSGVGGKGIMWAGLDMVQSLKQLREIFNFSYKIFGYGGVTTPEDYKKYLATGADIVMTVGGAMWNPYLAQEIKKDLGMTS
jgi:dihydroorotate dehydrogenase